MPESSLSSSKPGHFPEGQPEQGKVTISNPWLVKAVFAAVVVWAGVLAPARYMVKRY